MFVCHSQFILNVRVRGCPPYLDTMGPALYKKFTAHRYRFYNPSCLRSVKICFVMRVACPGVSLSISHGLFGEPQVRI